MTKYKVLDENSYDKVEGLQQCYTRTEWNDACKNPIIIHFADKQKPWQDITSDYAPVWWKTAMKIGITDQLLEKNLDALHASPNRKLQSVQQKLQKTYDEKAERGIKIKSLEREKAERGIRIQELEQEKAILRKDRDDLKDQINSIYNSRSYKVCRRVSTLFRKMKGLGKK